MTDEELEKYLKESRKTFTELKNIGIRFEGSYFSDNNTEYKVIITKNNCMFRYPKCKNTKKLNS